MGECPRCHKTHREGQHCETLGYGGTAPADALLPPLVPPSGRVLEPGTRIGEYEITGLIGEGGMGMVYAGVQPIIDKRVAIKVLGAALASDVNMVSRFMQEARAVTRIDHPNIIDVYFFGQLEDGRCYFVMEHLAGESLADLLERRPLSFSEARRFLCQMCDGLGAAHAEGILHRDLKPDNIFVVRPRRGHAYIKILDFGVAKLFEGGDHKIATREGLPIGTPEYMAPEQARGDTDLDVRADVYAVGIILYQVMTRTVPFSGNSFLQVLQQQVCAAPCRPSELAPVPPQLEALILRCLAKEPSERPATMAELVEELERVFTAEAGPIAAILADEAIAAAERPPAVMSGAHLASPAPGSSSRPGSPSPGSWRSASPSPPPASASRQAAAPARQAPTARVTTGPGVATPETTSEVVAQPARPGSRSLIAGVLLGITIFSVVAVALILLRRGGTPSAARPGTTVAAQRPPAPDAAPRAATPVATPPASTPASQAAARPDAAPVAARPPPIKRPRHVARKKSPGVELKTSR